MLNDASAFEIFSFRKLIRLAFFVLTKELNPFYGSCGLSFISLQCKAMEMEINPWMILAQR